MEMLKTKQVKFGSTILNQIAALHNKAARNKLSVKKYHKLVRQAKIYRYNKPK